MIKALLDTFGFLSMLPTGMADNLEEVAKRMYLFPLVGAVLGLLAGVSLNLFSLFLPLSISSAMGFFVLLALTGLHHLDGLLDFGDAIIFRGSKERRIEVIHDTGTGVGGFAAGLFVTAIGVLAAYEFVSAGGSAVVLFVVSATLAKLAMVFAAGFGNAAFDGMGSVFVDTVKKGRWQLPLAFILAAFVVSLVAGADSAVLLPVPFFTAAFFIWISKKMIG
ncbi:MAG: adenosylcobinamide-GDP ribazoletransferase, partial [Candidatus Hydrothermarchaeales archaeon]